MNSFSFFYIVGIAFKDLLDLRDCWLIDYSFDIDFPPIHRTLFFTFKTNNISHRPNFQADSKTKP
jgi:hypothetical protein